MSSQVRGYTSKVCLKLVRSTEKCSFIRRHRLKFKLNKIIGLLIHTYIHTYFIILGIVHKLYKILYCVYSCGNIDLCIHHNGDITIFVGYNFGFSVF